MVKARVELYQNGQRFCYHHLQNSIHGKVNAKRVNNVPGDVNVSLPNDMIESCTIQINPRDKRVLVCFDGDIPSGGLPKGSTVLMTLPVMSRLATSPLTCHTANVYKQRDSREDKPRYTVVGNQAQQLIKRHFILLKTGRAIFRKYKETLQPTYLIVDVKNGIADFSTSSSITPIGEIPVPTGIKSPA